MVVHNCKEEGPFIDYLHERGFKANGVNAKFLYYRLTFELFKAACDFKKIRRPEIFKKQFYMCYDEIYDPHDKVYGFSVIESDPLFGDIYLKQKESKPEVYDQLTKYIQQYSESAELQNLRKQIDEMKEEIKAMDEKWHKRFEEIFKLNKYNQE